MIITLTVIAGTIPSMEVIEDVAKIIQEETVDIVTAIPIDSFAFFPRPMIEIEYDDCLTYSFECPWIITSNAQIPDLVHLVQYKSDSKSKEYFRQKSNVKHQIREREIGCVIPLPLGDPLMSLGRLRRNM